MRKNGFKKDPPAHLPRKFFCVYIIIKVPISSKLLFSHQISHFMQRTLAKKFFDVVKKRFFL